MNEKITAERSRVLLAFATMYGQTEKIAHHLAKRMEARGANVTVRSCAEIGPDVQLGQYDAVLVAGPVIRQGLHVEARRFVTERAPDLR